MPARPSQHLDPRSEFVLDTRELGRRAGSMREVRRELAAPADWGLELVRVPDGAPARLDVRLESVMDGVLVTGSVTAPVTAECGRCLEPIHAEVVAPIQELFSYEPDPEDEESPTLDGDLIDLAGLLRDAVVLALPLNPVCDEACEGLCPGCGARMADVEPGHSHDEIDPRWAALATLTPPSPNPDDNGGSATDSAVPSNNASSKNDASSENEEI